MEGQHTGTVLFTGLAGGIGDGVKVGDIVIATHLVQHDMDASPLFPRHEIPLLGRTAFRADAHWNAQLAGCAQDYLAHGLHHDLDADTRRAFALNAPQVHLGPIASDDHFVHSESAAQALRDALPGVLCVEMEGAAVAQVCHKYDVGLAVIRSISDRADDTADRDFVAFLQRVAIRHYASIFRRLSVHFTLPDKIN